jgi:hypothetical protein
MLDKTTIAGLAPGRAAVITGNAARGAPTGPVAAWTPEQVAERLIQELQRDEFYILCQDNETTRDRDERRILWAAGDLVENRPALSWWHPACAEAFAPRR